MRESLKTSWALIKGAAAGEQEAREEFARRYAPVIRSYLNARWMGAGGGREIEDAVQQVFVECFKQKGVLDRADPERSSGFRAFFFGVVRNVAREFEKRDARPSRMTRASTLMLKRLPDSEDSLSVVFDQAWAKSLVREAAARMAETARAAGKDAVQRVEILRLRFQEALPIREIAPILRLDRDFVHHEYARARQEFKAALREVVELESPGSKQEVDDTLNEIMSLFA
jgi:RNA polymerase sigma-70 factor (ECF subfamily)